MQVKYAVEEVMSENKFNVDSKIPFISIVTVCKNAELTISRCLESVRVQTFTNYEHIIIDGLSADNTFEIVEASKLIQGSNITFAVSESDKGIYDAMNKGASKARGKWLYFLNSDDELFCEETLRYIYLRLSCSEYELFFGSLMLFDYETGRASMHRPRKPGIIRLLSGGIYQQCWMIKADTYNRLGQFDISYRLCGDIDILARAFKDSCAFCLSNIPIAKFSQGGASSDFELVKKEHRRVERSCTSIYFWFYIKSIKYMVHKMQNMLRKKFEQIVD